LLRILAMDAAGYITYVHNQAIPSPPPQWRHYVAWPVSWRLYQVLKCISGISSWLHVSSGACVHYEQSNPAVPSGILSNGKFACFLYKASRCKCAAQCHMSFYYHCSHPLWRCFCL
jgi:hypothetical protein